MAVVLTLGVTTVGLIGMSRMHRDLMVIAPATADAFCGFYINGAGSEMFNDATQVVLMRKGTRTVLSMQNNYQGPPENFAMVVPVPVVLDKDKVKTLDRAMFEKIDQLDAPRLVEYWEQDPCNPRQYVMKGMPGVAVTEAASDWPIGGEPRVVTKRAPTADEWRALRFAWRVCAHVKSNAVVFTSSDARLCRYYTLRCK